MKGPDKKMRDRKMEANKAGDRNLGSQTMGEDGTSRPFIFLSFIFLSVLSGCRVKLADRVPSPAVDCPAEVPTVNVPPGARMSNYAGGSCVHASIETLLNWQGRAELARWWRATHSGGEYAESFAAKLTAAGVRFAHTTSGDEEFLAWAIRTRRGSAVSWPAGHMVCLVHLDAARAGILDNNDTSHIRWVDRRTFVSQWRACGGWAVTPVYSPAAPLPFRRAKSAHHGGTEATERRREVRQEDGQEDEGRTRKSPLSSCPPIFLSSVLSRFLFWRCMS